MTQSIYMQAVQEVVALLQASPLLSGVPIYRTRGRPASQKTGRFVTVAFARSDPTDTVGAGAPVEWQTAIQVECYARGTTAAPADVAADDLYCRVRQTLQQPYLPQTDASLAPGAVQLDFDVAQEDACVIVATYLINQLQMPA